MRVGGEAEDAPVSQDSRGCVRMASWLPCHLGDPAPCLLIPPEELNWLQIITECVEEAKRRISFSRSSDAISIIFIIFFFRGCEQLAETRLFKKQYCVGD